MIAEFDVDSRGIPRVTCRICLVSIYTKKYFIKETVSSKLTVVSIIQAIVRATRATKAANMQRDAIVGSNAIGQVCDPKPTSRLLVFVDQL